MLFIGEVWRGAEDCCVRFPLFLSLLLSPTEQLLLFIQKRTKESEMKGNFIRIKKRKKCKRNIKAEAGRNALLILFSVVINGDLKLNTVCILTL